MLNWANRFNIFCFLDNNDYNFDQPSFDCILAAGSKRSLEMQAGKAFEQLKDFYDYDPSWLFGHLGYDLKNEVEKLSSKNADKIGFGIGFFFEPEVIVRITDGKLSIISSEKNAEDIFNEIENESSEIVCAIKPSVAVENSISKEQYISIIECLQEHILRGDCYEINFCQNFFSENAAIDPLYVYSKLIASSPTPFAALYKKDDQFCLCASPERFLRKTKNVLTSQPMKGTSKRNFTDKNIDEVNKNYLRSSTKEKSENVMVVDLVRNDLSKICEEGSVNVQELFGVYSFPQVHQMTSTVQGLLKENIHWVDAIKATFPMGSMTGAPKKKVMELIEKYETVNRGLFSGSIGYITPDADFDFNVVIRSVLYNSSEKYLSFFAGSGITFYGDPESEYEECLLKTSAIIKALNH